MVPDARVGPYWQQRAKALNQAVSRNLERFPPDFMFTPTHQEVTTLRSQIVTSNWGGRRYLPRVFTQEGVVMLYGVLRGKRAVEVNVSIMRAFVRLRELLVPMRSRPARPANRGAFRTCQEYACASAGKENPIGGFIHHKD
jgi:hypothetical protein